MPVTGDLSLMINLQRLWDIIRTEKENISRAEKSIDFWIKKLNDLKIRTSSLASKLQVFKVSTKSSENLLSELDQKLKSFEERKSIIKNEKELNALNAQIEKVVNERDQLENEILIQLDEIEILENSIAELRSETAETEIQTEKDIETLRGKISDYNIQIESASAEFEKLAETLSLNYKTRFVKLLNSKEGKSIIPINNETCSFCNNRQPPSVAIEAARGTSIPICVNCGRYLYITNQ